MAKTHLLVGFTLGAGLLLCACGESQEDASRLNHTLGGVKEGAPLGPAASDAGILQDATAYQPQKIAAGALAAVSGKAPLGRAGAGMAAGPADADTQIKAVVAALVNAIKDGEADLAVRLFEPEQVQPLDAQVGVLFNTFEKIDLLRRFLRGKVQPAVADRLVAGLIGADAQPKWEVLDADHAGVTPNPATILFGTVKASPSLQLVRKSGEWKFQLEAPLSDADGSAIKAYHEQLQVALDEIVEWLDKATTVNEAELKTALANVVQGKPAGLDGAPAKGADEGKKEPSRTPPNPRGGRAKP